MSTTAIVSFVVFPNKSAKLDSFLPFPNQSSANQRLCLLTLYSSNPRDEHRREGPF